mmetsp:Transcript_120149/g.347174  ORF Transcript_120149/g.347174 Transcript_120149/m.347174 type:complete len:217 (+) Transcript_120149:1204-1854(+)
MLSGPPTSRGASCGRARSRPEACGRAAGSSCRRLGGGQRRNVFSVGNGKAMRSSLAHSRASRTASISRRTGSRKLRSRSARSSSSIDASSSSAASGRRNARSGRTRSLRATPTAWRSPALPIAGRPLRSAPPELGGSGGSRAGSAPPHPEARSARARAGGRDAMPPAGRSRWRRRAPRHGAGEREDRRHGDAQSPNSASSTGGLCGSSAASAPGMA